MGKTVLSIRGRDFYINGTPVYAEIGGAGGAGTAGSSPSGHPSPLGLLMNSRFIQGVFDDKADPRRFDRFGRTFDPETNTDNLIAALPEWYKYGLRAITVGFQGGWPVFTTDVRTIDNNPFGTDGRQLDEAYAARMDRIIRAADSLGMVVIVNFLYWAQAHRLKDGRAVVAAIETASSFIKNGGYTNVIIDLANEYNIEYWNERYLIKSHESMQVLMDLVRRHTGGSIPVGCTGGGGIFNKLIAEASDVVLIHGNGLTRGRYYDLIRRILDTIPDKPVLCNEDSPCISRLEIAARTHTSWGHYDNFTKQEPPANFGINPGQDTFFARRMAKTVGIQLPELPLEEQFYLEGLEPDNVWQGQRWIRLSAEYPERIDHVNFYRNGELIYTSYDEPFLLFGQTTWIQKPWLVRPDDKEWLAEVVLSDADRTIIEKRVEVSGIA
ncbi:MAG TPA: glycoside hydrolase family 5 protein [Firmicutes bacterium]|nr:glycoside hydrolase family 5 protein [Bacillota bacterium]